MTCRNCLKESVYVDSLTGENAEFCSHKCRKQAVENGVVEPCVNCEIMPRALVRGQRTLYCGKTCKNENAMRSHLAYKPVQQQYAYPPPPLPQTSQAQSCQWCHKNPAYRNSHFCSLSCRDNASLAAGVSPHLPQTQHGHPPSNHLYAQPGPSRPPVNLPFGQPGPSRPPVNLPFGQPGPSRPPVNPSFGQPEPSRPPVNPLFGQLGPSRPQVYPPFEQSPPDEPELTKPQSPDPQPTPEQSSEQSATNQQQNQPTVPSTSPLNPQQSYQPTPTVQIVFHSPGTGSTSPMNSQFPAQMAPTDPQVALPQPEVPAIPAQPNLAAEPFNYSHNDTTPTQPPPPYSRYDEARMEEARMEAQRMIDEKANAAINLEPFNEPQDSSPYFPGDSKITRDDNYDDENPYAHRDNQQQEKPHSSRDEGWVREETKWDNENGPKEK